MRTEKWIVMVEDDLDMHYLYQRVFRNLKLNDRLQLFDNAEDALAFLTEHGEATQIIFSDINMPKVDGIELKQRINKDRLLSHALIPFIYLSTSATKSDIRKTMDLGIQGFFQKGETLEDIENTIRMILSYWSKSVLA
jgi:CheY-like chemotaxis protein